MTHNARGDYEVGGTIEGRWLIRDIKKGGQGRVYICEQIGRQYERGDSLGALKTPLKHLLLGNPEVLEAFYAEAANWIALPAHPNVVLAYGVELHGRLPYIVMEYVDGGATVADEIIAGRASWREAITIGLGAARGLAHAQAAAGLSHGDIKPANVLLTRSGTAKVSDFGFSVSLQTGVGASDGWLVGTPGFRAPEMYQGHTRPAQAADIYAFGVMLFQMVARRSPLPTFPDAINCREDAPDPRAFVPETPPPIAALINACLQRDPAGRPSSFADIVERLESAHREWLGRAAVPDAQPDLPSPADALRNAAQSWLNIGEWNKADGLVRRAIETDPGNWPAHSTLGLIKLEAGDFAGALRAFEQAHALAPHELLPFVNAAQACHGRGDRAATSHWLSLALGRARSQDTMESLDPISNVICERLPAGEALALCDAIIADNPHAATTWNNRAIVLRRAGRIAESLESAERAVAINPVYAKAWNSRANALLQVGRFEEALTSAVQAIELDPLLTGPYLAKASALAQQRRFDAARACIAGALQLKPGDPLLIQARDRFAEAR